MAVDYRLINESLISGIVNGSPSKELLQKLSEKKLQCVRPIQCFFSN